MRGLTVLLAAFLAVAAAPLASASPTPVAATPLKPGELGTESAVLRACASSSREFMDRVPTCSSNHPALPD